MGLESLGVERGLKLRLEARKQTLRQGLAMDVGNA